MSEHDWIPRPDDGAFGRYGRCSCGWPRLGDTWRNYDQWEQHIDETASRQRDLDRVAREKAEQEAEAAAYAKEQAAKWEKLEADGEKARRMIDWLWASLIAHLPWSSAPVGTQLIGPCHTHPDFYDRSFGDFGIKFEGATFKVTITAAPEGEKAEAGKITVIDIPRPGAVGDRPRKEPLMSELPPLGASVRVRRGSYAGHEGVVDDHEDGGGEFGNDPPPSQARVRFNFMQSVWFHWNDLEVIDEG